MKKVLLIIAVLFVSLCYFGLVSAWSQSPNPQCTAVTKSGNQCKLHTTSLNGLCHLHGGKAVKTTAKTTQCSTTTKAGNRCKLHTSNTNGLCHLHSKKQ